MKRKVKRFPKLIVEVLSASTKAKDRGDKFIGYQSFDSLEEYVLISAKYKRVEIFRRSSGGLWVSQAYQEDSEDGELKFKLKSVGLEVSFHELYEDVRLKEPTNEATVET